MPHRTRPMTALLYLLDSMSF
ncbi:hypothetical protein CFP56_027144 [Quercus suber]|uniref:Uncharacterized protein n=1 Tax=Quercus suber TaxID=58331 RepID=A0AAW0JZL1_QUESU